MAQQAFGVKKTFAGGQWVHEGSFWGDYIELTGAANLVEGYNGDDTIVSLVPSAQGVDTVFGGDGNDYIDVGDFGDLIDGGSGRDTILAGAGRDNVNGGTGDDHIDGGRDDDTIDGGQGNDYVFGGHGNDIITDISGNDRLLGGIGDDTITVRGGELGFDTVEGDSGNDTIIATRTKVIANGNGDNDTFHTDLSRDTFMIGGNGSDRFVITGAHPVGSGRIAEIHGGEATVTTTSFLGIDSFGGIAHLGDTGVDTLDLSQLPSTVGTVNVNLTSGTMHDFQGVLLANMTGIENVVGTSRVDTIIGNDAANDLRGGGGDDHLNGGRGDDTLIGGTGRDTIIGGSGRDRILGDHLLDAASADTLTGGADSDIFVFVNRGQAQTISTSPISKTVSVMDQITDFDTTGTDRDQVDLSAIFDLHTNFNGTAQQAIDAGYIYFVQSGNATKVMFDANGGTHGDAANNFAVVELAGVAQLDLRADHFLI
jgi:Ca2+-binding RTX toxin-like protein